MKTVTLAPRARPVHTHDCYMAEMVLKAMYVHVGKVLHSVEHRSKTLTFFATLFFKHLDLVPDACPKQVSSLCVPSHFTCI